MRVLNISRTLVEFDTKNVSRPNMFLCKGDVDSIVYRGGLREIFTPDSSDMHNSVRYYIENGDTFTLDLGYNPVEEFETDTTVKLCRFDKDNEYVRFYGSRPHFYFNDPDKKFLNCKQVTYAGVIFGYLKLVNEHEIPRAAEMKNRHLMEVCGLINQYENMRKYRYTFFQGKRNLR